MNIDNICDLRDRTERLAGVASRGPASDIEVELADTLRDLAYVVRALAVNHVALTQQVRLLLEGKR